LGLIIAPGREEEWTLSILHTDDDIDLYVNTFEELVKEVTAWKSGAAWEVADGFGDSAPLRRRLTSDVAAEQHSS
jgi:hypothetical protein